MTARGAVNKQWALILRGKISSRAMYCGRGVSKEMAMSIPCGRGVPMIRKELVIVPILGDD